MMSSSNGHAFWIDHDYDESPSDPDGSRFLAYVRQRDAGEISGAGWLDEPDGTATACGLWRIATPPVMAPGYVRHHARVHDYELGRNDWDGGLYANITVVTSLPDALSRTTRWEQGRHWGSWKRDSWSDRFEGPGNRELVDRPFALATTQLVFPLPSKGIVAVADPAQYARENVAHLVAELNAVLDPIVAELEGARR